MPKDATCERLEASRWSFAVRCLPLLCQDVYHACPKEFVAENMLVTQQSVAVAECYAGRET